MNLDELRAQLDQIDKVLEEYFVKRMEISAQIADYKEANGLPTTDPAREKVVLEKHGGSVDPLYREYTMDYFSQLIRLSKEYQNTRRSK